MNHITTKFMSVLYQEIYSILTACNFYDFTCNFQWGGLWNAVYNAVYNIYNANAGNKKTAHSWLKSCAQNIIERYFVLFKNVIRELLCASKRKYPGYI